MSLRCDICKHQKDPQGGWCYMFESKPSQDYCAAFKLDRFKFNQQQSASDNFAAAERANRLARNQDKIEIGHWKP